MCLFLKHVVETIFQTPMYVLILSKMVARASLARSVKISTSFEQLAMFYCFTEGIVTVARMMAVDRVIPGHCRQFCHLELGWSLDRASTNHKPVPVSKSNLNHAVLAAFTTYTRLHTPQLTRTLSRSRPKTTF